MIEIDGSEGEGGGQILRSSLSLAICTQQPFRISTFARIARRPGLMRQHLTAVNAAAEICAAEVDGAELGLARAHVPAGQTRGGRLFVRDRHRGQLHAGVPDRAARVAHRRRAKPRAHPGRDPQHRVAALRFPGAQLLAVASAHGRERAARPCEPRVLSARWRRDPRAHRAGPRSGARWT